MEDVRNGVVKVVKKGEESGSVLHCTTSLRNYLEPGSSVLAESGDVPPQSAGLIV